MPTITVRNGSSVVLTVSLPYRRLWNYTVLAYDCEEHPLLETNEQSNTFLYEICMHKCLQLTMITFRHS